MQYAEFDDDDNDLEHAVAKRAEAASRSTWVSVAVNIILTTAQITIGIFSRSQGLVADGIHSLSDLVSDFVVLLANRQSKKEADQAHPYGYMRYETAASMVIGLLLFIVGLGMLWSAVEKLQSPAHIPTVHQLALWVACGALLAKECLFRYMLCVAKKVKSSLLVANAWHARSDAASSLVVAFGITGNLLGYPLLDPIAALVVGLMISRTGFRFTWKALRGLMDHAADEEEVKLIQETILKTPGVLGMHDLRTRKMGDMTIVDVHIEVKHTLNIEAGHNIAVLVRRRIIERHDVLNVLAHVDPAYRPDLDHLPVKKHSD